MGNKLELNFGFESDFKKESESDFKSESESDSDFKFIVVMFPYPSGDLHVGHWYNYAIMDSYCRYLRFTGNRVFQPFGYDSFGLPAENAARRQNRDPQSVTYECIDKMRTQMQRMNTNYEELLITSDKWYQKYTQWVFTELLNRGLAYKAKGIQDYCPSCETVLAREQVREGRCERCETMTVKKELEQWYFKITDYRQRLIRNLTEGKSGLPESTVNAQLRWLENQHDWCVSRQRKWGCPIPVQGETDTMDTFVDSSFYFIIYCLVKGVKPKPVDLYVGGREHACMHLIYARFITMFLYDTGFIDFEEPFKRVIHQGMILKDGQKMSKSKGNVVNLDNYDSDEIRFYLMFLGHYFDGGNWTDEHINGIRRFIRKMTTWLLERGDDTLDVDALKKQVFAYTESFKFNKVVSSLMIFLNQNKHKRLNNESAEALIELMEIYMPAFRTKLKTAEYVY